MEKQVSVTVGSFVSDEHLSYLDSLASCNRGCADFVQSRVRLKHDSSAIGDP